MPDRYRRSQHYRIGEILKKTSLLMIAFAALGVVTLFIGANSVEAKRAEASKGEGCYVKTGPGENDYALDPTCDAHDVIKMEDANTLDFYVYQDRGQTAWHPDVTYRSTYE